MKTSERRRILTAERSSADLSEKPPFPKRIMLELSNICNHKCTFCALPKQTRRKTQMDAALVKRMLMEAHALGSRELGLFSGAEPFASPNLEDILLLSKTIGYEYVYISTNGSVPTRLRLQTAIDNGLDSLKFSINGGDRQTYRKVHGVDHFDKVVSNIKFVDDYRKRRKSPIRVSASFVSYPENQASFAKLETAIGDYVDEIIKYRAINGSGQMYGFPTGPFTCPCPLPFEAVHITVEGYVRACCNDYQNYTAVADLNKSTLEDAFYSPLFQTLRRNHLDNTLENTICYNCLYNQPTHAEPVNPALATPVDDAWFDADFMPPGKKQQTDGDAD